MRCAARSTHAIRYFDRALAIKARPRARRHREDLRARGRALGQLCGSGRPRAATGGPVIGSKFAPPFRCSTATIPAPGAASCSATSPRISAIIGRACVRRGPAPSRPRRLRGGLLFVLAAARQHDRRVRADRRPLGRRLRLTDEELASRSALTASTSWSISRVIPRETALRFSPVSRRRSRSPPGARQRNRRLPTIDYLFADPVSTPPQARHHYAERIHDLPCLITLGPRRRSCAVPSRPASPMAM